MKEQVQSIKQQTLKSFSSVNAPIAHLLQPASDTTPSWSFSAWWLPTTDTAPNSPWLPILLRGFWLVTCPFLYLARSNNIVSKEGILSLSPERMWGEGERPTVLWVPFPHPLSSLLKTSAGFPKCESFFPWDGPVSWSLVIQLVPI